MAPLPQAKTFRTVLKELKRRKKETRFEWKNNEQYVCYVLHKLFNVKDITLTEHDLAIRHVERALLPYSTLSAWLLEVAKVKQVYEGDRTKVNDHRIEWVERIIKELS